MTTAHAAPVRVPPWTLALIVLGALGLAVGVAILDAAPVGVTADDAMYVILGKSLATGQGYRALNLPGAPAATHFPPGYPALLALLWRVAPSFPGNLMLFKAANALFLAVTAVGTARLARRTLPDAWALAAGVLAALAIPLLVLCAMIMSEPLFLALLLLLLPDLESFVAPGSGAAADGAGRAARLGVAIGLLVLVRTHGIVLLPAVVLVLLARRRGRDAAIVATATLAILAPWQLWSAAHGAEVPAPLAGEYGSYLAWWMRGLGSLGPGMITGTLGRTTGEALGMFAVVFSPSRSVAGHLVTLAALAGLAGAGAAAARRRVPVTLLFLAGYVALTLLWPFPSSRFLWSVWPLFVLLLLAGARDVIGRARADRRASRAWAVSAAGAGAALWLAAGHLAYEVRGVRGRWWTSIPRANAARIVPMVQWTLANTAPGDVIAVEDAAAAWLYTGRRAVPVRPFVVEQYLAPPPAAVEAEQGLTRILAAYPVRVVIVGSTATLAQADWLAARPTPLVARRDAFPNGIAFSVLPR